MTWEGSSLQRNENKTLAPLLAENGFFSKIKQIGNWNYWPNQKNHRVVQNEIFSLHFQIFQIF